jgi:chemotaxis regulatin CheY-phosphate phosphatase CheZ
MTQEELDAIMAGELDFESEPLSDEVSVLDSDLLAPSRDVSLEDVEKEEVVTPPPATREHRVVEQLDDVTRDSEEKAGEIFDALEGVMGDVEGALSAVEKIQVIAEDFEDLFMTLRKKFPHIRRFNAAAAQAVALHKLADETVDLLQGADTKILGAMDTMQYQDIHRQKIERVINIMRALNRYLSALFEGKIEDEKRATSARHIAGDRGAEPVLSNDDIEALIAQFGGDGKKEKDG